MSPDDQPDLDPSLTDAVRRAYVRPVDEVTAQRHVSAIVAAARTVGEQPAVGRARRRRRVWRPVLAAGAATLLAPVGMAAAGVDLPDAVERPYRIVGITLPHQASQAPRPSAPATGPGTPSTSTTPSRPLEPRRPQKQRERDPRPAQGNSDRAKREGKTGDRPGRKNESPGGVRRPPDPKGRGGSKRESIPRTGARGRDRTRPQRQATRSRR